MSPAPPGPAVLAFGGNALLPDPFRPEGQEARARELAAAVVRLLGSASGLVLVHGNGPQVGTILLRVEATRDRIPVEPLDVLVAETQGSIGYLLTRALRAALHAEGSDVDVTTILTQVVVDAGDVAFREPTKPIGPAYDADAAERIRAARGWAMVESGGGWRRVVPSPRPLRVLELAAIADAARSGDVVVAGGGGGVPVREDPEHAFAGVEAVVDKDRTAALLAVALHADPFVILTGVPHVSLGFGTPEERPLRRLPVERARELVASGTFPPGSMGPKVEAACDYAEALGRPALVTDAARLEAALEGEAGTWILPRGAKELPT